MIPKKGAMPLALIFLALFTIGITTIVAAFAVIDQLFLSVPHCEDLTITSNNICYNEPQQRITLNIRNSGEGYINSLILIVDGEEIQIPNSYIEIDETFDYSISYVGKPETIVLRPVLNRRGQCSDQQISINEIKTC